MRSKLLISGSRPELFAKAMEGQADALSIDLEDAVVETRKGDARAAVGRFLRDAAGAANGARKKSIIVRINAVGGSHFDADLAAITGAGPDMIDLPVVESIEQVFQAVYKLEKLEQERGLAPHIKLLASIESPKGVQMAAQIAEAHPRLVGLQLGYQYLLEPMAISRGNAAFISHVQMTVRLAAAAAGVRIYDAPFNDINDPDGFQREADVALGLGFSGKACIHPSQVGMANAVFQPGQEQIMQALRILEAAHIAQQKGQGSVSLDGRPVEPNAVRRAEQLIELALQLGILSE